MRARALSIVLLASTPGIADELVVAADDGGGHATVAVAVGCLQPGARCEKVRSDRRVVGIFGLRADETAVEGSDVKAGVSLSTVSMSTFTDHEVGVTARAGHFAFVGGSRGGMEGGLGVDIGLGLTQELGRGHGPFSRLGGRGFLLGHPVFYASMIELPQIQLGYQILRGDFHLELSARGGPVLAGRLKPGDDRRKLGGTFEWGGHLALGAGPLDLAVEFSHIEARGEDASGGVNIVSALLCGGARTLGACFDAKWFQSATDQRSERVDALLLAVTLGSSAGGPGPR
jgi:hypothetical protein